MKIVVAGGAGFLGSHLCERLLGEGHEVICIDNLITGNEHNIAVLRTNPRFKFVKEDICSVNLDEPVDQIYHLASPASPNIHSPKSYLTLDKETMKANTVGTWNLVQQAIKHQASLLYASTSETYGDPLQHPQTEEYRGNVSTTGPRSVYDEAKRFGETIVAAFTRKDGLEGKIIRIFNTYGPRMDKDDGRVVTEFIKAAKNNVTIPLFGDGSQTRSFCYVSDLVEGMIRVMNNKKTTGQVINLGNPGEFTIKQLAEMVVELTGSKSEIKCIEELPADDPKKRKPDISKAKQLLDWEPKVTLREGLKMTIAATD